jgi:hypothetical protein
MTWTQFQPVPLVLAARHYLLLFGSAAINLSTTLGISYTKCDVLTLLATSRSAGPSHVRWQQIGQARRHSGGPFNLSLPSSFGRSLSSICVAADCELQKSRMPEPANSFLGHCSS